ncbi:MULTISPECIES: hypothetical protein [Spirulina sp. CCY15215]|uniref:hypothetical protein n=1 Tax=Spirulina sp. CCY15215 TaxID=2767591 RepID=UPI00194E653A|nr:hypothetical protein [Spirulina major]
MTTIAIIPESDDRTAKYRAICGQKQAIGSTPGQALDNIEQQLNDAGIVRDSATAIILHRTQSDRFFPSQQHKKLQDLMARFHETSATRNALSDGDRQELDRLAELELEAAIQRSQSLLQQIQSDTRD